MKKLFTLAFFACTAFVLYGQCNTAIWLECSQILQSQTTSATSSFSINNYGGCLSNPGNNFQGGDRVYQFILTHPTNVSVNLNPNSNGFSGDLGLFLLSSCSPATCIDYNIDPGSYHTLTNLLPAGHYYVVVENMGPGVVTYDIELNCGCSCGPQNTSQVFCENFSEYNLNDSLSANSIRWNKWSTGADDALVLNSSGSQKIIAKNAPGYETDIWMNLFSPIGVSMIAGRYRLSFTMTVASGQAGNYYLLHSPPNANGSNQNIAYRVIFNPNGTGSLVLGNPSNIASATFTYVNGAPTNVMQIVDLDNNVAELWINNEFIYSWAFNTGYPNNTGTLGALNFDAHPTSLNNTNFNYTIDDICFSTRLNGWSICQAITTEQKTCIKNGVEYFSPLVAMCELYNVDLESKACPLPCDNATWLECSQMLTDQTFNGISNFSIPDYNGCLPNFTDVFQNQDLSYKFELKKTTEVTISIKPSSFGNSGSLAVFLLDNCDPTHCIDFDASSGVYHTLTDTLQPGLYYIVVEERGSTAPFNIQLSCGCACFDYLSNLLHCETFESFLPADQLSANSERWHVWDDTLQDVPVTEAFGNQSLRIFNAGTYEPDIWLDLFPTEIGAIVGGRYRLSFEMTVSPGKYGNYYVHHAAPDDNGNGQNIAYRVVFYPDGTGKLILGNPNNTPSASFVYVNGAPTDVMQILDLNQNVAELWINHEFIYSWSFNIGSTINVNWLADVNFDAHPASLNNQNFDYSIDNVCFTANGAPICSLIDPVPNRTCIKNGQEYYAPVIAACDLYNADLESIPCQHICDYGGTLIYRGDSYAGSFDQSDVAPPLIKFDQCVKAAYNNAVPANLHSDVYVFYNASGGTINLKFNNNGNTSTKCFVYSCYWKDEPINQFQSDSTANKSPFCMREPHCLGVFSNASPTTSMSISTNTCDDFYYFVVTGLPGATYSGLNITPSGPCDIDPPILTCGGTINGTITGLPNSAFSKIAGGTAYNQCYAGIEPYNGAEEFYRFTLDEPKKVKIKLDASARMGIFLYNFICGLTCMDYAENTAFDTQAEITAVLNEGTYYIVVDKATTAGSNNFSLALDCFDFSPYPNALTFENTTYDFCPPDPNLSHQVGIYSNSRSFAPDDKIMFRYPDNDGFYLTSPGLTRIWDGTNPQIKYINLEGDTSLFPDKCAYAIGDTFFVTIFQTESGQDRFTEYIADYLPATSPGVNAIGSFQNNGISLITHLKEGESKNFVLNPSDFAVKDSALVSKELVITTNEPWTLQKEPIVPAPWLTLSSTSGEGQGVVTLNFEVNTSEVPRSAYLRFTLNSNPALYRKFVKVTQKGKCNRNPALNISATPASLCGSGEVTLTANVGAGLQNIFRYKWSNGDTSYFTKVYPTATTTYSVTITNIDCFVTKTASKQVTVNTLPASPLNPINRTICQGGLLTQPLAVSLPAGANLIINWYDQPINGNLVKTNSITYSPTNLATSTFYAETKNTTTLCVSSQRIPVTLTVNPVPSLSVSPPFCAADLSYSVSASTNGTSITSNAGSVSFSNGTYTISQIPTGTNVIVTAHYSGNNTCINSDTVQSPVCNCPLIAAPIATQTSPLNICQGDALPLLTVAVGPGIKVYWYNQSVMGNVLPNGSNTTSYQPIVAGTYYAEARDPLNNCSSLRTAITVNIIPKPVLTFGDTICHINLANGSTYSVEFTSSIPALSFSSGLLSGPVGNVYILNGVPVGTDVTITADAGSGCKTQLLVHSPQCACPNVAPPSNPTDAVVCDGESPMPLHAVVPAGYQIYWFGQPMGGQPLTGGLNTPDFLPPTPGTYYAEARSASTGCPSKTRTPVHFVVEIKPAITIDSFVCFPANQQFDLYFSTNGDAVFTSLGLPVVLGNGKYVFHAIPNAAVLTISSFFQVTGCVNEQMVSSPGCTCPVVPAPISAGNKIICEGDIFPELKVSVGTGQQAQWYASAVATQPLGVGNIFLPNAAGTYYVRARDLQTNCLSTIPTAVSLSISKLPIVSAGMDQTVCAGSPVFLSGSVQNASGAIWKSTIPGGFFAPSNGVNASYYTLPGSVTQDFVLILTSTGMQPSCPERSDTIFIHQDPLPTFSFGSFQCAPNLQTGYLVFTSNATGVSNSAAYPVEQIAPQSFQVAITNITNYNGFSIDMNNANNCSISVFITGNSFTCPCPGLEAPSAPDTINYCVGDTLPVLKPVVAAGIELKWYDLPLNGNVLFTGNVFPVPGPGIYYMQGYDLITQCSTARIPITVIKNSNPIAYAGQDATICPGASTTLNAQLTGVGQTYQWSTGANGPITQVTIDQNTLYTLTVTSAAGCSSTDVVQVSAWPTVVGVMDQLVDIQCYGDLTGSLKLLPSGGLSPYKFLWNTGSTANQINNLAAGTYTATVTDAHTCTDTISYNIIQPNAILLASSDIHIFPDCTGSIKVVISGGVPPYQYFWERAGFPLNALDNLDFVTDLIPGPYVVKVLDQNNCAYGAPAFNIGCVSIQETDLQRFVNVSPNPTNGILHVKFDLPFPQTAHLTLRDILGRELTKQHTFIAGSQTLNMDLGQLPAAMYLLTIQIEKASTTYRISLQK